MEEKIEPFHLLLEVVTPRKIVLREEVTIVLLPCAKGYLSAMPFHRPLISTLKPGILEFMGKNKKRMLFVEGGFVEILSEKVTVLAERVEKQEEIDFERAKELKAEALEKMKSATPGDKEVFLDYEEATQKLMILDKDHFVL